ncbi:hypothetical protein [Pseudoalteromonas ardens]|uniref:Uncharacterized protein n=1 Tax=Pseudoalteromonas rubra TaxID=43658 RepID=A0A0L0EPH8_9GAMM|nr:hypothetical protein [Pseudoalteromonas sp. R96]KNC66319.1 hypothetical protein AC626_17665 [Pseudoalteromonas rubra]MDK1312801.1 hypothetical protein [Pseudoalteromonas sp. R96]
MHILKIALISIVLFSQLGFASGFGELEPYVPKSRMVIADVMILSTSKEVEEIGFRLQNSFKEHPDWFRVYVSTAEKGKPLAFHKNFGITKKEYEYFLTESQKMQLVKTAETRLKFALSSSGNVEIMGLPASPPHNRLEFNVKSNQIEIAKTTLNTYKEINQNKASSATGRWKGKQWSYKQMQSESDFKSIKFAIGTKLDEQKHIIYYDVNIVVDGQPQMLTYILLYSSV